MNRANIVFLCIAYAVGYGVAHDQLTVRLCPEYFTVAHPLLFPSSSLTFLALCWGTTATLPLALVLGLFLASVAQAGPEPPIRASEFHRPLSALVAAMAVCAVSCGFLGYHFSKTEAVTLPEAFRATIPSAHHHRFAAAWFAHMASYGVGLIGAGFLIHGIWHQRGRPVVLPILPKTRAARLRAALLIAFAAYILWLRFR